MNNWIDVKNKLPELTIQEEVFGEPYMVSELILIVTKDYEYFVVQFTEEESFEGLQYSDSLSVDDVLAWTPITLYTDEKGGITK